MSRLFLITVLILAAFLRFYRLGDVPVGFHRDEAFLGFNAYSILQTGKDISGNFLPLHLESFLYSPAGYSYLSIPFIKFFDLSAFSVRFASALFGSLTILITFFLVKELFKKWEVRDGKLDKEMGSEKVSLNSHFNNPASHVALLTSFLLAISPWHINLSRTATENTIVVFFIALGTLLFLTWVRRKKLSLLILAFLCFSATLLIYQAPRAFIPFFLPLLFLFLFAFTKFANKRKIISAIALFFITIIIPLVIVFSSPELSLRIRTVSVFATQESQLVIDEQIREDGISNIPVFVTRIFHNKPINYSYQFFKNYFSHFSFDFLFTDQGLPIRYKVPNMGLIYLLELPFLLLGILFLLQKSKRISLFLVGWVLLTPMGSALTFDDVPNFQRALLMFPALSLISAVGLYHSYLIMKKFKTLFYPAFFLFLILAIYNVSFYLHQYYVQQLVHQPWYRQEGYKELVEKVNNILPNYKKAIITNRESAPTIFFLVYGKYEPSLFQKETRGSSMRDFDRVDFDKYYFSQEECPLKEFEDVNKVTGEVRIVNNGEKDVLYVNYGVCKILEKTARLIDTIKRKDQTTVFQILEQKE